MEQGSGSRGMCRISKLEKKLKRLVSRLKRKNITLNVIDPKDIAYGAVIGKGGEGVVRRCTVTYQGVTKLDAAAKILSDNSADAVNLLLTEIELLCFAQNRVFATTVNVYGAAVIPDEENPLYGQLVIITEAGQMSALQLYQGASVPLAVTLDLWSRLAAAIHLIHKKHIIHHDLKPDNVLITDAKKNSTDHGTGTVDRIDFRIIDLGMARRLLTDKVLTDDIHGTDGFHPPEVLFEEAYDFRADVFMLGITFAVLLHSQTFLCSKKLPFLFELLHSAKLRGMAGTTLFERVIEPTIEQVVPGPIKRMICNMIDVQEKRTISLCEVARTCREAAIAATAVVQVQRPPPSPPATQKGKISRCVVSIGQYTRRRATLLNMVKPKGRKPQDCIVLIGEETRRRATLKRVRDYSISRETLSDNVMPRKRTRR